MTKGRRDGAGLAIGILTTYGGELSRHRLIGAGSWPDGRRILNAVILPSEVLFLSTEVNMSRKVITVNALFYGDNLNFLCDHIMDISIGLVCLDPPFNTNRLYNAWDCSKKILSTMEIKCQLIIPTGEPADNLWMVDMPRVAVGNI